MTVFNDQTLRRKRRIEILKTKRKIKLQHPHIFDNLSYNLNESTNCSELLIDDRRVKNRLSAAKSRNRKILESQNLIVRINELENENQQLKLKIISLGNNFPTKSYIHSSVSSQFIQNYSAGFNQPAVF